MSKRVYADGSDGTTEAARFSGVRHELNAIMQSHFSGSIAEAMRIGQTAGMCMNLIDGTYEVSETSFAVKVLQDEKSNGQ